MFVFPSLLLQVEKTHAANPARPEERHVHHTAEYREQGGQHHRLEGPARLRGIPIRTRGQWSLLPAVFFPVADPGTDWRSARASLQALLGKNWLALVGILAQGRGGGAEIIWRK